MRKICVLASGGDAPVMNACVEAVFNRASASGIEVWAAIMGFDGLVRDKVVKITPQTVRGASCMSGCVYKCGRSPEFTTEQGFAAALGNIKKHGFECIIVIGGNGSFMGLGRLKSVGVPVIGIPGTVDNDVFFTKHNLGFSSACESAVALIDVLKSTMLTNNRDHVVQLMGRYCSDLAQTVGIATFADVIDTNDHRHTPGEVAEIFKQQHAAGVESCTMILQEYKKVDAVAEALESAKFLKALSAATNDNSLRMNTLGYLQRGANPSARDRWLGSNYGALAVDLAARRQYGVAVGLIKDEFAVIELDEALRASGLIK